jgi:hypothetical protein
VIVDTVSGFPAVPNEGRPEEHWATGGPAENPSGWRALGRPLLVAGVAVAAAALVHVHDPHVQGSYGICPFYALTGWWCPGCGGLRAMHDLTQGRVLDAVHSNLFLLPLILGFSMWWVNWSLRRWRGLPTCPFTMSRTTLCIVLAALAVFTVLRNTPWGTWLTPV